MSTPGQEVKTPPAAPEAAPAKSASKPAKAPKAAPPAAPEAAGIDNGGLGSMAHPNGGFGGVN